MIEDNPQNLYLAKFLLEKAGYEVGRLVAGLPPVQDDAKYLKRYNERLIRKLEEKMEQLEETNRALADSQMFLHTMIQSEPECVKLMGADGRLLTMNPAGLAMIQAESLADVRGKPLHTLVRPLHRAAFKALTEAVFRGEAGVLEFEIDGLKGAHRWLETHAVPLRGPDGDVTLLGLTRDITERKRAEQEVKELTRDLEARVADRTAELIDANRELESFSYSVSHDLRAPLRVIDGFSKILLDDERERLDETAREHLRRIRAAAERMGHLIDDLLDLSRVSRTSMRREPVDLSALAQSVAAVLRATDPEREVEWVMAPGVTARGDSRLLRIALENLFGNAWKFTKRTERPRIEFGLSRDGDEAIYWVRDNGAGFDMGYADRLFGTFQRLHTSDEFPGTGVGLAIVRRIIQRHGGRIWAEGAVGRGAVLSFTLNVPEEA